MKFWQKLKHFQCLGIQKILSAKCWSFVFQFTASFEGKYSPILFSKELYIGTVPLNPQEMKSCIAGMFNQPFMDVPEPLNDNPPINPAMKASSVSLTQIIAAASTNQSQQPPSAPTLATLERHLGAAAPPPPPSIPSPLMERPPPYAPGHEGVVTSAPMMTPPNPPKPGMHWFQLTHWPFMRLIKFCRCHLDIILLAVCSSL